ncbi:hypothetical protein C9374_009322 [Naegleria lovaniensis]|uniref:Calponin-homology (CH) domain-containing protein n=1 Tax=Naegleria lovaniensis TaxID=51637 RepID=A0AA88KGQ9_NAELO|nr:uncharacterized protein C9374_009322 [Naegleria lovaniensis]KAG2377411.1 hypothetical protein C9374_009322 [Naegleria lovaniensis]
MSKVTQTKVNALLYWAQNATKNYDNVDIKSFSSPSFADGLAWCAIIHHFRPDLIDYASLSRSDPKKNLELAFRVAEKELGCTQYLEVDDLLSSSRPEPKSIQLQLNEYRRVLGSANEIHRKNSDFGDLITDYEQSQSALKRSVTMPSKSLENPETPLNKSPASSKTSALSVQSSLGTSKLSVQSSMNTTSSSTSEPKTGIVAREVYSNTSSPVISVTQPTVEGLSLEEAKKKIKDLYEEISSLKTDADNIKRENSNLSLMFQEAKHTKEETETVFRQQNESLKQKVSQQRQDLENERNAKQNLENSIAKLKDDIENYKKEISENKKKLESLEKEKQSNKDTKSVDELQKQVTDLTNQVKHKERIITQLETEKTSSFQNLQKVLAEKEKEMQSMKNSLKNMTEQADAMKQEREKLETQIKTLSGQSNNDMKKLEETIQQLTREKQTAERAVKDTQMQMDDITKKLSKTEKDLEETRKTLDTKLKESQQLQQEAKSLKEQQSKFSQDVTEKQKNQEKEQSLIKENQEKLLKEKQKLEKELEDIKKQLSKQQESSKELEKLRIENKKLEETINKLTSECTTLKKEVEKVNKSKEEAESALKRQLHELDEKHQQELAQTLEKSKLNSSQKQSILDLQLEDLRERCADLKKEKESVENELKQLESKKNQEIEDYKKKISNLESELKNNSSTKSVTSTTTTPTTTSPGISPNLSKLIEQERQERFILDQSIICFDACTFTHQIPTPVKPIFYALCHWLESSETFGVNLVSTLNYKFNSYISTDLEKSCYWLNVMVRLIHMLKLEPEYEKKMKAILKSNILEKDFSAPLSNQDTFKSRAPVFLNYKYSQQLVTQDSKSQPSSTSPSVDKFLISLAQLTYDCYFECIYHMLLKAKPLILEKMFGLTPTNSIPLLGKITGDVKIDVIVRNMSHWMDQIKNSLLDTRLIVHMFEVLAKLLDSLIFNQFISSISSERLKSKNVNQLRDLSMNHAIHLKMSVSFLESFFFEEHLTAGLNIQDLFHQTREGADVCVLGQKDLLQQGNDLRDIVCPHLSTPQISILLLESSMTAQDLIIPKLSSNGYTDPNTFSKQTSPLFDFENKFMSTATLHTVQYPSILENCNKQEYFFLFTKSNMMGQKNTQSLSNMSSSSTLNESTFTSTPTKNAQKSSIRDDEEYDVSASSWASYKHNGGALLSNERSTLSTSSASSPSKSSSSSATSSKKSKSGLNMDNGLFD